MNRYNISIMQYPTGKYGFVGSLPLALCDEDFTYRGEKVYKSKIVETREEAEALLKKYE